MINQIFILTNKMWKSIMITDTEFWISYEKEKSVEAFAQALENTGMMRHAMKYPLTSIKKITFNEATKSVKLIFTNEKDKIKKMTLDFDQEQLSNQFGETLGSIVKLNRSESKEGMLKVIAPKILYLIMIAVGCIFLMPMVGTGQLANDTSANKGKGIMVQMIIDTIGQTGIVIIALIAAGYTIYQLYKRYKNPYNNVVFTK